MTPLITIVRNNDIFGHPFNPNQPVGMTEIYNTGFSALTGYSGWNSKGSFNNNDTNEGQRGFPNSIQANWLIGDGTGNPAFGENRNGGLLHDFNLGAAYNEVYFNMSVYFSSNFQFHPSDKWGPWLGTGESPGVWYFIMDTRNNHWMTIEQVAPSYTQTPEASEAVDPLLTPMPVGSWVTYENWTKAGTGSGQAKQWCNGFLAGERTGMTFSASSILRLDPYWGGGGGVWSVNGYTKYSWIYISVKN